MFEEAYAELVATARKKSDFLKTNPAGYLISSALAGIHVGIAMLLIYTIGGLLQGTPIAPLSRTLMGLSFAVALSLVVMAGSELFTGNNMVMTGGAIRGSVTWSEAFQIWGACYLGNWAGSVLLAFLFWGSRLPAGQIEVFVAASAATKMNVPLLPLFLRGVLCNLLVCLGVWCGYRCKSESGKLIMIFWCIYAFITTGYEHSVANMTLLTLALLAPNGADVSLTGYFYNIAVVTLGNMTGGILLVALPYHAISKNNKK